MREETGSRHWRVTVKNGLLSGLLMSWAALDAAAANWLDQAKQTAENLKQETQDAKGSIQQTWQESERRCVECGKIVHGMDRCASCEARLISDRANEIKAEAQRKWQESERRCLDCGKVVHGQDRCVACESQRLAERARETAEQVRATVVEAKRSWDENKDGWKENARQAVQDAETGISGFLNSPKKQKEVIQKLGEFKRDLDITLVKSFPVVDPKTGDIIPFGLMAENMIRETGVGGSFGEDPVRTAYLMMIDTDYLFSGARLLESPSGEYVTLNQALALIQGSPTTFNRDALDAASGANATMRTAYQSGNSDALNRASREFADAIVVLQRQRNESANTNRRGQPSPTSVEQAAVQKGPVARPLTRIYLPGEPILLELYVPPHLGNAPKVEASAFSFRLGWSAAAGLCDDGKHGDLKSDDRVYSYAMQAPRESGEYPVAFAVDGEKSKSSITIRVR